MESCVRLSTKFSHHKTVYDDVYFTPPYKLIAPLYEEDEAQIMLMSSSAGLLQGDRVHMDLHFGEKCKALVGSQSYEKVFDTQGGDVQKNTHIKADARSRVRYMPHPTIPFKNSTYRSKTHISLASTSTFFYSDIFTAGRVHMGESFLMRLFHASVHVYVENRLAFADNTLMDPARWDYTALGLWQGFSHNGLLYAYFPSEQEEASFIEQARQKAKAICSRWEVGVSKAQKGVCVRVLGDTGDKIYLYFKEVSQGSN